MNPTVYSSLTRKYGLGQSLLDRLYDDDVYRQKEGSPCKVELNENHRSHPQVSLLTPTCQLVTPTGQLVTPTGQLVTPTGQLVTPTGQPL